MARSQNIDQDHQEGSPDGPSQTAEGQGQAVTVSVGRKLMLNAGLWAMEASCGLEYIYSVPLLQTLGMPMRLSTLTGLVAGPSALLLLPLVGWITDKGSNPRRRKMTALIGAACLLLLSMSLLIVANVMHLLHLRDLSSEPGSVNNQSSLVVLDTVIDLNVSDARECWLETSGRLESIASSSNTHMDIAGTAGLSTEIARNGTENEGVPLKAGIGMLGFVLLDMGFDGVNAFSKSFILTCTPRCEHTSVLLVGLVMASAGGVSTAALGVVDFTSLLGLSHIEGGRLSVNTMINCAVVIVFGSLGFVISLVAERNERKELQQFNNAKDESRTSRGEYNQSEDEVAKASVFRDALGTLSCSISMGRSLPSLTFLDKRWRSCSEAASLLADTDDVSESKDSCLGTGTHSLPASYGSCDTYLDPEQAKQTTTSTDSCYGSEICYAPISGKTEESAYAIHHPKPSPDGKRSQQETLATKKNEGKGQSGCTPDSLKAKIACICVSAYLSFGLLLLFSFSSSDYVGKAICGGDPRADPGSDSLARYQECLGTASWGFLIYFSSYLLMSIFHHRILAVLSYRGEFVLTHMLLGLSLMTLALTTRLEVFFLTAVVAGFQRACFYFVPYAVTNDIIQSMPTQSAESMKKVGLAMSLVSASVPLACCTVYALVGPLEDFTGMVSMPLWLGAGLGCLSSASFLLLGKV